jgi:hypothetical protein
MNWQEFEQNMRQEAQQHTTPVPQPVIRAAVEAQQKRRRKRVIYWWTGGVAAMLLLAGGAIFTTSTQNLKSSTAQPNSTTSTNTTQPLNPSTPQPDNNVEIPLRHQTPSGQSPTNSEAWKANVTDAQSVDNQLIAQGKSVQPISTNTINTTNSTTSTNTATDFPSLKTVKVTPASTNPTNSTPINVEMPLRAPIEAGQSPSADKASVVVSSNTQSADNQLITEEKSARPISTNTINPTNSTTSTTSTNPTQPLNSSTPQPNSTNPTAQLSIYGGYDRWHIQRQSKLVLPNDRFDRSRDHTMEVISFGAAYYKPVGKRLALRVGGEWAQYTSQTRFDTTWQEIAPRVVNITFADGRTDSIIEGETRYEYHRNINLYNQIWSIRVPLELHYRWQLKNRLQVAPFIGITGEYQLGSEGHLMRPNGTVSKQYGYMYRSELLMSSRLGCEVQYPLGQKWGINMAATWQQDLLGRRTTEVQPRERFGTFGLRMGLAYKL